MYEGFRYFGYAGLWKEENGGVQTQYKVRCKAPEDHNFGNTRAENLKMYIVLTLIVLMWRIG